MALRSSLADEMGIMLNFSCKRLSSLGETNAGNVGPSLIFLIPRYNSVNRIQTGFCSYQDKMI